MKTGEICFNGKPVKFVKNMELTVCTNDDIKSYTAADLNFSVTLDKFSKTVEEFKKAFELDKKELDLRKRFADNCEKYLRENPNSECSLYVNEETGDCYFCDKTKKQVVGSLLTDYKN